MGTIAAYILAAFAEIGGCFAFWAWLRLNKTALWLAPGISPCSPGRSPARLRRARLRGLWRYLHPGLARLDVGHRRSAAGPLGRPRRGDLRHGRHGHPFRTARGLTRF